MRPPRFDSGVLPASLSPSWLTPRVWLAIAAGVGCGVCGYAGLYPRFDGGDLRLVLALTSAPFGAAVIGASVGARSPTRAFGRAMAFASLLGIASIILPSALLASRSSGGEPFVAACIFGAFIGAPVGALYGIPLAILAALGNAQVAQATYASSDRAARTSGVWLFCVAMIGLTGTCGLDEGKMDWATQTLAKPSPVPGLLAIAAAMTGLGFVAYAVVRMARRKAWIERVREGLEPAFRLRPLAMRDGLECLPRLGQIGADDAVTVLEWIPDEVVEPSIGRGSAYRIPAVGRAVAIVSEAASIAI